MHRRDERVARSSRLHCGGSRESCAGELLAVQLLDLVAKSCSTVLLHCLVLLGHAALLAHWVEEPPSAMLRQFTHDLRKEWGDFTKFVILLHRLSSGIHTRSATAAPTAAQLSQKHVGMPSPGCCS